MLPGKLCVCSEDAWNSLYLELDKKIWEVIMSLEFIG